MEILFFVFTTGIPRQLEMDLIFRRQLQLIAIKFFFYSSILEVIIQINSIHRYLFQQIRFQQVNTEGIPV